MSKPSGGSRRQNRHPRSRRRGGGRQRDEGGEQANPGRVAAARAQLDVREGAHLEEALATHLPAEPRDRGLGWFLGYGVQRRRGQVDAALRPHLRQPLASLDPEVQVVLRLGAFEKLFGRAGAHAVVHQWVEVSRRIGAGRASGLVNAVLRRCASRPEGGPEANHPAWLVDRWIERYGEEAASTWMGANDEAPPVFVVAPDGLPEGLVAEPAEGHGVGSGVFLLGSEVGPVTELPGFEQGRFWVQDLAAVAVADLTRAGEGTTVLDACAAPGGKSFRLASHGAVVHAVDRSDGRLDRLREGAERLGQSITTEAHDWSTGPLPSGATYDVVLVDAPCTGLGTVRRHPEIRWRRSPVDLPAAAARQRAILDAAATHVAPGGRLVYAVCSPEPEEGEEVVDAFVASHPSFERVEALHTAPPTAGEDAHAAFVLKRS